MDLFARLVTAPPTTVPGEASASPSVNSPTANTIADLISGTWDNLARDGYQTGAALIVATLAVVIMVNLGIHKLVIAVVAVGAFWAGWLGYNTVTQSDNPLFPSDVSATKLWDIAFESGGNFLFVAIVACVAAVFLWRTSIKIVTRIALLTVAVLGASFLYNLYEAVRQTTSS